MNTIDLSGFIATKNLARYLVDCKKIETSSRSSSHHSSDSNTESNKKNDYGDTPSSRSLRSDKNSEFSDEVEKDDIENIEFSEPNGDKIKKMFRLLEKNRDGSDDDSYQDEIYGKVKSKKKVYNQVAYDGWYGRGEDDEYD